jgi:hypothetical protein
MVHRLVWIEGALHERRDAVRGQRARSGWITGAVEERPGRRPDDACAPSVRQADTGPPQVPQLLRGEGAVIGETEPPQVPQLLRGEGPVIGETGPPQVPLKRAGQMTVPSPDRKRQMVGNKGCKAVD